MIKNISNLGDAAIYCDFGSEVNRQVNHEVIKYFNTLKNKKIKGITNLAPSYNKLIITFDLDITNYKELIKKIRNLKLDEINESVSKKNFVPICIDEEFALDVDRVSKKTNLSFKEIYKNILNKEFYCYMTGFVAGMPFLGDTDKNIRLKRLETPRVKVPKGSIGITEQFCNIYTFESPGGWNIIGNTPVKIFDKNKEQNPILIKPGDSVQFYEITKKEFYKIKV
tara:strand:+ start:2451 stop:3125 length:675 start_codon:yes stop_codon:yes gene_type:complete